MKSEGKDFKFFIYKYGKWDIFSTSTEPKPECIDDKAKIFLTFTCVQSYDQLETKHD